MVGLVDTGIHWTHGSFVIALTTEKICIHSGEKAYPAFAVRYGDIKTVQCDPLPSNFKKRMLTIVLQDGKQFYAACPSGKTDTVDLDVLANALRRFLKEI